MRLGSNYGDKHKGKKITPISLAKEQIIRDKKKECSNDYISGFNRSIVVWSLFDTFLY